MQLSSKARKAVAITMAASTVLWASSFAVLPQIASAAVHSNGCLVLSGGTVWLITNGTRKGFTSAEVFASWGYNFFQVVPATAEDVALPVGPIMIYADGTLVKGPSDPLVYLVAEGQKRGFVSGQVFTDLGFQFSNIKQAPANTFADIPTGANITASTSSGSIPHMGPAPQTVSCTTGGSGSTSGLGSSEGSISDLNETSTTDSTAQEGTTSEVFGFTATIDGDVQVNRVDIYVDSTAAGSESNNADDYFQSASLMVDGSKVGTVDVSDWTEDSYGNVDVVTGDTNEYRIRFSGLALNFADGDEPEFVLALKANSVIDSGDQTETWGAQLADDSIRFVDGQGFSDTDGDNSIKESFGIDTEDTAELQISESSNDPEATTIEVSDSDMTSKVEIFDFDIKEKNGVDVTVDDMTITVTTAGTTDESAVLGDAFLYNGSTLLDSTSVPTGGVLSFENMGLNIDGDGTAHLKLKVDFEDVDGYTEGSTVTAAFTSIDDATDANGNDESDMTITGSATSNTHEARSNGIKIDLVGDPTTTITDDGDGATFVSGAEFKWTVDITAFGDNDVYINKDVADIVGSSTAGDVDILYSTEVSTGAALTGLSGTITSTADDVTGDSGAYTAAYNGETFYKIASGDTERFEITVTGVNQTDSKQVRALLNDIEWTTDLVDDSSGASDGLTAVINSDTFNLGEDAATPFKAIN